MNLEIKHIAAYLPYDLEVVEKDSNYKRESKIVTSISSYRNWVMFYQDIDYCPIDSVKLCLKPMSLLTKEELQKQGFYKYLTYLTTEWANSNHDRRIGHIPFEMIEYLLSQKYDIFNLIEKGLAVKLSADKFY